MNVLNILEAMKAGREFYKSITLEQKMKIFALLTPAQQQQLEKLASAFSQFL